MPMMILNRNHFYASTDGNTIGFKKGEPSYIPNNLVKYAISIGADFVNEDEAAKLHPKNEVEQALAPPIPQGDERVEKIKAVMRAMHARNNREDFTAAGIPATKVLEQLVGFDVDLKEKNELWKEVLGELESED